MSGFAYLAIYDTTCVICGTILALTGHWRFAIAVLVLSQVTAYTTKRTNMK